MKKLLFLCAIIAFVPKGYAQLDSLSFESDSIYVDSLPGLNFNDMADSVFKHVSFDSLKSNYFLDRALKTSDPSFYDGSLNDSNWVDHFLWRRLYGTMARAMVDTLTDTIPQLDSLLAYANNIEQTGKIALMMMDMDYDQIRSDAVDEGLLEIQGAELWDINPRSDDPFEQKSVFAASPSFFYSDTNVVEFVLPSKLFISNRGKTIDYIRVNFDNGDGWNNIALDVPEIIVYDTSGTKEIVYEVHYTDNTTRTGHSFFKVDMPNFFSSDIYLRKTFIASKNYGSAIGAARVTVSLGCGNTKITKPLIVIEGFDPPQNQLLGIGNWGYYNFLSLLANNPTLYSDIEQDGYDLIFVDFINGADYMQANAFVVEDIIRWVNTKKTESGSTNKNMVLGLSMGGVIGRYALVDMEENSENHDCAQLLTFDSPHRGANIPLGVQAAMAHLRYSPFIHSKIGRNQIVPFEEINQIHLAYSILENPATRQLLIHQLNTGASLYQSFFYELEHLNNNRGFPNSCPTKAIVNGSANAQPQSFSANSKLIEMRGTLASFIPKNQAILLGLITGTSVNIDMDVYAVPDQTMGSRTIYKAKFRYNISLFTFIKETNEKRVSGTLPIDNAPGGTQDLIASANIPNSFTGLTILNSAFCFVPTISSASVKGANQANLLYNLQSNNALATGQLDIDDYEASGGTLNNEPHLSLTATNERIIRENLISNFLTYPSVSLSGKTFNYGGNTTDRIQDVTIGSGEAITINRDEPVGLSLSTHPHPVSGSTFSVYTYGANCFGSTGIDVQNGGELIVGDEQAGNKGNLFITQGSVLSVSTGGTLRVENNSKVVIERGAYLNIDGNPTIELTGSNSVLEIQGTLNLAANSDFTIIGNGYIRFSLPDNVVAQSIPITTGNSNCTFVLSTNNQTNKVMEVAKGWVTPSSNLALFKIYKGTVELGTDAYLNLECKTEINNTTITSNAGSGYVHKGIKLGNQSVSDITIRYSNFFNAKTALWWGSTGSGTLTILGTQFQNCDKALHTVGNGVDIKNVRFIECNTAAWLAESMTGLSDFSGYVEDCDNGLVYSGSTGADLFITTSQFNTNIFSVIADGDITITSKCSKYEGNISDFILSDGCTLNLSTAQTVTRIGSGLPSNQDAGGNNKFINSSSEVVYATDIYDILLDEGYNSFTYSGTPGTILFGSLSNSFYSNSSNHLNVTDNYWSFYAWVGTPNPSLTLIHYPTSSNIELEYSANNNDIAFDYSPELVSAPTSCNAWNGIIPEEEGDPEGVRNGDGTGVKPITDLKNRFAVYPNPAFNKLNLTAIDGSFSGALSLIDMTGRIIPLQLISQPHENKFVYDLSSLSAGIYQVFILQDGLVVYKSKLSVLK
ncbi:MAG: T9SS type A sorting domain-containing protein [Bacteroidia bacterium]|nr:T9SS type A sorting domain-containing protein [Bacteroidia bacterium]